MKIHEDRSHMNIDTRWFEKGYIKEDVHSLRLQSLCTEAEAAANKQFYDSHTREEWDQYIRQASLESSAAMKPVMEAIAQDFVCYQYDENIPVSYGSDRWDLYFWCNPFNGAADASERDFSYFTLTFNERQTLEKRKKVCQQVLELLCSRFQEHPHLHVAVQYSIWFDHPKIHDAVERAKPRLHGLRCIQEQKEGKLLLQDGALLFKPKYAKKYARTLSQSQILSLSWELGVEDEEPDTDAAPVTLPYKKFGATHPIQLQVTSYLNGNPGRLSPSTCPANGKKTMPLSTPMPIRNFPPGSSDMVWLSQPAAPCRVGSAPILNIVFVPTGCRSWTRKGMQAT